MTSRLSARVVGSGSFLPPHRLDNHDLYELPGIRANFDLERARKSLRDVEAPGELSPVEVFDLWARQVTGIRERRLVTEEDGLTTEDLCTEAGRRALESAGLEPEDLDYIVAATLTASDSVPNLACTMAAKLGVPNLPGFALNTACAGFVYAMSAAYAHILSGMGERVLAVAGDALSHVTDYEDPKTAVLFADGAGAVVLEPTRDGDGVLAHPSHESEYAREHLYLRGQGWEYDHEPNPALRMGGGPHVLRQAIQSMMSVAEEALERTELDWEDIDYVIPHQANLRITRGLERHLAMSNGRVVHTIEQYGNLSASTVGVALDEVLRGRHGPVPDPCRIVLTAVGGGYTSAALVLEQRGGLLED